ncbi:hypothetical protein [Streptomyces canus]|uniref:hypothetical protein n=1 Tax=Streptomyces canus TaxID=58343 RepID=UPI0030E29BC9
MTPIPPARTRNRWRRSDTDLSWSEKGGQKHMTAIGKDVTTLIQASDPIGSDNAKAGRAGTSLTEVMDVQSSFHSFAQRIEDLRGQS